MSKKLTAKQETVLGYLERYLDQFGYPPSIREIGKEFEIRSLRGVTVHLDALEKKGYISRESTSRSIRILHRTTPSGTDKFVSLPLLGTIAAGEPLLAVQNIEAEITVPRSMVGNATDVFLLRVRGDSMIDAHILDGDLVVIRSQQQADNGDLVAALLGDEATVKRLRTDAAEPMLLPANKAYQPISLKGRDVSLIGKVVGLLRSY